MLAWVVGEWFGNFLLSIVIILCAVVIYQFYQMYKFNQWVWRRKQLSPPDINGAWERLYDGVFHVSKKHRQQRKELTGLIKRFREGAEALPDAVVIMNTEGKIVWCNRLATLELGIKWPNDKGVRIDHLIRNPEFVKYFNKQKYTNPIEVTSPVNDKKLNEFRIMSYGQENLLLVSRDITRYAQLEEMRGDFVANVSHELRTPLTVMNGYLEMLSGSVVANDPLGQKACTAMHEQAQRMQDLVEDLSVLSRIESSAEKIYEHVLDIPSILRQIEVDAQRLNSEKEHSITFYIDPDLYVYGVATEMRSAISNLVFNALNYTPNKGDIEVHWYRFKGKAICKVIDNGEGIAQKHIFRLTERFYRVDQARSRHTGGSGLGLSIVKHVLNHHNSSLEVKSRLGEGSEFSFALPRELVVPPSVNSTEES
jgi:two-component system phosphate regulon sensor histidine kinase PhoR